MTRTGAVLGKVVNINDLTEKNNLDDINEEMNARGLSTLYRNDHPETKTRGKEMNITDKKSAIKKAHELTLRGAVGFDGKHFSPLSSAPFRVVKNTRQT